MRKRFWVSFHCAPERFREMQKIVRGIGRYDLKRNREPSDFYSLILDGQERARRLEYGLRALNLRVVIPPTRTQPYRPLGEPPATGDYWSIGFYCPPDRFEELRSVLREIGRDDLSTNPPNTLYGLYFNGEYDTQRFLKKARASGFDIGDNPWREERIYTDQELASFPLLEVGVPRAQRGDGGPRHGTQYDLSTGCRACGAGASQISPLFLRRGDPPKKRDIFATYGGELLVSERVAETLKAESVTGLDIRQARGHKDKDPLPWWQLIALREMPRVSPFSTGFNRDRQCATCGRDGHYNSAREPTELAYAATAQLEELPDVVRTWECMGVSGLKEPFTDSRIAQPLLLVKPRVFQIIRRLHAKPVAFSPVRIIG